MLTASEFLEYAHTHKLDPVTVGLLKSVRGEEGKLGLPVRRAESKVGNAIVRYPSRKMGFVTECESGRPEFYAALWFEHDPDVLEFWSQPVELRLHYPSGRDPKPRKDGSVGKRRQLNVGHTPDFLVLRRNGVVEFVECKSQDGIEEQRKKQPHRYEKGTDGRWFSPPGETAAATFKVGYRIWTPAELAPSFVANLRYLDPFYHQADDLYPIEDYSWVLDYVRDHQGIVLDELVKHVGARGPALVRWLLVQGRLFGDFQRQLLSETDAFRLYTSSALIPAVGHFAPGDTPWPAALTGTSPGPAQQVSEAISYAYQHFGETAFGIANRRWAILNGLEPSSYDPRTVRIWKKKAAVAEQAYGRGFLGLIPNIAARGNRKPRYSEAHTKLAREVIAEFFLDTAGMLRASAYRIFVARCEKQGLTPIPKEDWFYVQVKLAASPAEAKLLREGRRAAYPLLAGTKGRVGALDVHGDYPMQVVHIDHTLMDAVFVSRNGFDLGRAWLTVAFDAYTRSVVGFYVTFDEPSVVSVQMVLRDIVFRHGVLPVGITVDNGKEFHSVWFETFCALHKILVFRRPPREARFGSLIENFFGIANKQFIHTLLGNTQLTKNIRQLTKSIAPENFSVWTLPAFYSDFEHYCFKLFNFAPHPDVGPVKAEVFEAALLKHGIKALRAQPCDDAFLISSMDSVDGGTCRVQPARGVKVRWDYFYHTALDRFVGQDVLVKYDAMDPGRVFAFVNNMWVPCLSKFSDRVACLSVRQVELWCEELRKRHSAAQKASWASILALGRFIDRVKTETEGEHRVQLERAIAHREMLAQHPEMLPKGTPLALPPGAEPKKPAVPAVSFVPVAAEPFESAPFHAGLS